MVYVQYLHYFAIILFKLCVNKIYALYYVYIFFAEVTCLCWQIAVPKQATDDLVKQVITFRSRGRLPVGHSSCIIYMFWFFFRVLIKLCEEMYVKKKDLLLSASLQNIFLFLK